MGILKQRVTQLKLKALLLVRILGQVSTGEYSVLFLKSGVF